MCKMMMSPAIFFIFFKILIFQGFLWGVGGLKGQKMVHNHQFQSATHGISRTVDHFVKVFGTRV